MRDSKKNTRNEKSYRVYNCWFLAGCHYRPWGGAEPDAAANMIRANVIRS